MDKFIESIWNAETVAMLKGLGLALAILLGGWILAKVIAGGTRAGLRRTQLDNRIARALGFAEQRDDRLERVLTAIVYYTLMLFVVVAALDAAGLATVSGPIRGFLDTVLQSLPLAGKAALVLLVAFAVGKGLQIALTKIMAKTGMDSRLAKLSGEEPDGPPFGEKAGKVVFWLLLLVGLAGAVEALGIDVLADPLRNLLDRGLALLPLVAVAALILGVGWMLGQLARSVVANLLNSMQFDELAAKAKLDTVLGERTPSDAVGWVALVLVMLHAGIAALEQLQLTALSGPLQSMVSQLWNLLPSLLIAALILAVAVVVGRVARAASTTVLERLGFDKLWAALGLDMKRLASPAAEDGAEEAAQPWVESPSQLVGILAQLAVFLVAMVQALTTLGLDAWAGMVDSFLAYTFLNVVVAIAIVAVGFAVGSRVRDLVSAAAGEGSAWMGGAARVAILVFAFTMGLQRLEVASTFVLLAFGLLFGALCLALGLAFGLGGKDTAGDIVRSRYSKLGSNDGA